MNIPVVYEDDWYLAADKPAGLLTIPTPKGERRTLTSILNDNLAERKIGYRLHPCHRLDRETSGVILYAKGKAAQKRMMDEFRDRRVKKTYLAFVQGSLERAEGEMRLAIEGRPASTRYRVLERRKGFTVVEVEPATGRTNQIRIHFRHLGHPIVGESRFAFRKDFVLRAKRLCLHAATLSFTHPATGREVRIDAPLAADMRTFLEKHPL